MHVFVETPRLVLRRFTMADVDNLVSLDADPGVIHYQAFLYAFAFHPGHGPRQASLVYPSDRSEVNQRLAVRGSGITQATLRGVRVNLSELVARAAVGPTVDPDLLMLCTGATNAQPIAPSSTRLSHVVSG